MVTELLYGLFLKGPHKWTFRIKFWPYTSTEGHFYETIYMATYVWKSQKSLQNQLFIPFPQTSAHQWVVAYVFYLCLPRFSVVCSFPQHHTASPRTNGGWSAGMMRKAAAKALFCGAENCEQYSWCCGYYQASAAEATLVCGKHWMSFVGEGDGEKEGKRGGEVEREKRWCR